jgi:hypothetical protein
VNIGLDDALLGRTASLLLRRRQSLLAEIFGGRSDIAVILDESLLAVHHAGTGCFSERLDRLRVDGCRAARGEVRLSVQGKVELKAGAAQVERMRGTYWQP